MTEEKPTTEPATKSVLKRNLVANFGGTIWQALMGFAFIPLYVRFMGIESYGLVAFYATLQSVFALFDVGLGNTLTRELARLSVKPGSGQETRNLVRTLETLYWIIALFAGTVVVLLSSLIAHHWLNPAQLPQSTAEQAVLIMGFIIVFQMPVSFYTGGLMGLQKQVLLNVLNVCISTLRAGGAVLVLWKVAPTIQAFFVWQICLSVATVAVFQRLLWRNLPAAEAAPSFEGRLLKGIWKFSAGMGGISVLAVILTQLDKIVLSKMLPLEEFGYYMIASVVAMSLGRVFTPVFFSIYPRFTQLVSVKDHESLRLLYHKVCQFMSVLVLPAAAVVAFFSYDVILLWTQNPTTAEKTHLIVSVMIGGTALNGIMNPPYALQLAFGWTKLSVIKNIIAVIIVGPLIVLLTNSYGAVGAAGAWLILNIGYVLFEIPVMHGRILQREMWQWYRRDFAVPVAVGLAMAGGGRLLLSHASSQPQMLFQLILISSLTLGFTLFSVPAVRVIFLQHLPGRRHLP
ncbi:MAG TPA: oligosaccharide flippase family protein [Bacteroidota bacterium]|nr:oligosaccharide flippase family protein [Bacteroidota bacterium]